MRFILFFLFIFNIQMMLAQNFTQQEKLQGYANRDADLWFIFDEKAYGVQAQKVLVTGQFRNWSQDLDDPNWALSKQEGGIWTLKTSNFDFSNISPLSLFKFRIDDGKWMDPPQSAPNGKGGNLVYMKGLVVPTLKVEILHPTALWASIEGGTRPLKASAYRLTDAAGNFIPIAAVLPNTATETLIIPAEPLDIKRVYFLKMPSANLTAFCSFDGWFRTLYSNKALGANISEDEQSTTFRLFAPRAEGIKLYLYKNQDDKKAYTVLDMKRDEQGVWEAEVASNLHGVYYDFTVHGSSDPGNHFYDTDPVHISDPYARVNAEAFGKSRVWKATRAATPLKNGIPKMEDLIAYEVHVQDFTDQLPVTEELKGTIPAMIKRGLKNKQGEKIGFDYLLDLGINVVHLMPVQEYLHFPDKDWKASFKDDEYMISQGINEENYQWGYRTTHCFAVESKYRQKNTEPGMEREQFRDLVQAFHNEGIAVIIDIVPNHTGENMDGLHLNLHFNVLDKLYYYRTKNFKHIGAYGNEVKTENRPMVQRWLIDQCQHFINEFGIDGFRIDLAGQIDEQTLIKLKEALGEDKIVYGEAWIGSNDPNYEENPDWDWYKSDAPITFFQDDARNAFKGPVFALNSKEKDRGWPGGNTAERDNVKKGLTNFFPDDKTPISGINYLDIHDNFTLADQFATKDFDGRFGVDENLYKIAATLLYTSVGPIVTHGGTELMRSKGAAPPREVVKTTKAGYTTYLHGKRDTYNHRLANNFIWENVGKTAQDKGSYGDYKGMYQFWKGLNHFRLSDYGKAFRIAYRPPENYYQWIEPENKHLLGYIVDAKILVLLNTANQAHIFEVPQLPAGKWKLIGNSTAVDIKGVKDKKGLMRLKGNKSYTIEVEKEGLKIWVKE